SWLHLLPVGHRRLATPQRYVGLPDVDACEKLRSFTGLSGGSVERLRKGGVTLAATTGDFNAPERTRGIIEQKVRRPVTRELYYAELEEIRNGHQREPVRRILCMIFNGECLPRAEAGKIRQEPGVVLGKLLDVPGEHQLVVRRAALAI